MQAVLRALAFLAILPCALAHEVTTSVIGPAPIEPSQLFTASNGRVFITIWTANGHLYASTTEGASEASPLVAVVPNSGTPMSLVAAGNDFVVALAIAGGGVQIARIDERGKLVSVVRPDIPPLYRPRLAWNGESLLLIGRDVDIQYLVYQSTLRAYLLTRDGAVTRTIGPVGNQAYTFGAAADPNGGGFSVAVSDDLGLRLFRIGADGSLGASYVQIYTPISSDGTTYTVEVAVRQEMTAVIWYVYARGTRLALVRPDGIVTMHDSSMSGIAAPFQIVTTNSGYAVASYSSPPLMRRLDPQGDAVDGGASAKLAYAISGIAAAGDLIEIVGVRRDAFWSKIWGSWFLGRADAPPKMTALLTKAPSLQMLPVAGSDGVGFFATFTEMTADLWAPKFARFTSDGRPLDGVGIDIAEPYGDPYHEPLATAAYGGGRYLVAWNGPGDLQAAFVGADGSVGPVFFTRAKAYSPRIVWNGSSFFMVWWESYRIHGATISLSGAVSAPRQISPDVPPRNSFDQYGEFYWSPDVAWNGRQYLVTWAAESAYDGLCSACEVPPPTGAYAIHVGADGVPVEKKAMPLIPPVSSPPLYLTAVHVAASPQNFLVLIDRFQRVDFTIVSDTGFEPLRPFFDWLPTGAWYRVPAVTSGAAFDGLGYQVAWRFGRGARTWLAAQRLSVDGKSREPARSVEAGVRDYDWAWGLSVAASSAGDTAIVSSEGFPVGDIYRLHARFASELPLMPAAPLAPRNVAAKIVDGRTTITWDGSSGADGYLIEGRRLPESDLYWLTVAEAGAGTYTNSSAIRGSVRVRAYNRGGLSDPSPEIRPLDLTPRHRSARH
jgi:hypothetical protein